MTGRPLDVVLQHLDDAVNGPAMIHVVSEINIERPLILGNCCGRVFITVKFSLLLKVEIASETIYFYYAFIK